MSANTVLSAAKQIIGQDIGITARMCCGCEAETVSKRIVLSVPRIFLICMYSQLIIFIKLYIRVCPLIVAPSLFETSLTVVVCCSYFSSKYGISTHRCSNASTCFFATSFNTRSSVNEMSGLDTCISTSKLTLHDDGVVVVVL